MIKRLLASLSMLLFLAITPLALANGTHTSGHEEDTGIGHQLEEILPFHHFAEGHMLAGVMLIVLWAALFYMIYSLIQLLKKK